MKKKYLNIVIQVIIMILGILVLISACLSSNQAMISICIPQKFHGEYSLDNGTTWNLLDENTSFSALDGNLILKGNFEYELAEGSPLHLYLNHINANIYVNGEHSFIDNRTEIGLTSAGCCKQWLQWDTPQISKNDIIEIYLENPHKFGNKNAYNEFLNSIYGGSIGTFKNDISKVGMPSRIIGFTIIIVAIMLLAVSLSFKLMQISGKKNLKNFGLLALFFGGYLILDTTDISLWSNLNAFNTYGLYLCIELALFWVVIIVTENIKSKIKKITDVVLIVSALTNFVLFMLSLLNVMVIYDTQVYFFSVYIVLFTILLGCCIYEYHECTKKEHLIFISNIIFLVSVIIDMVNAFIEYFPLGILSKVVFLILFLLNLIRVVKVVPMDYRKARQTEKLKSELADSRISIMLSQIKPHFLYNVLNIIYYLCEKDTKTAQKAIVDFSSYLRGNMDALTKTYPVPFSSELEHIRKYVYLEKMRFDDTLEVIYDIQTENFLIPSLTVQPLVENAIKHGICQLENGGTVKISSRECEDYFEVEIRDNGVGFDMNEIKNDGKNHVGIENVKNRLWKMSKAVLEITSQKNMGTTAIIKIPK